MQYIPMYWEKIPALLRNLVTQSVLFERQYKETGDVRNLSAKERGYLRDLARAEWLSPWLTAYGKQQAKFRRTVERSYMQSAWYLAAQTAATGTMITLKVVNHGLFKIHPWMPFFFTALLFVAMLSWCSGWVLAILNLFNFVTRFVGARGKCEEKEKEKLKRSVWAECTRVAISTMFLAVCYVFLQQVWALWRASQ